ncbi:unnamed protein product [Fasciola hepatica]|uniref:Uncharacterized protein n=1 Tax=Fasciola hepatica TaxID=6192 RepID=A0ABC9HIQ9_FASHE
MNMKSTSNNHLDILQYPCDISSIHYFLAGFRRGGIHSASSYVYSQGAHPQVLIHQSTNSMNPGSQPAHISQSDFGEDDDPDADDSPFDDYDGKPAGGDSSRNPMGTRYCK